MAKTDLASLVVKLEAQTAQYLAGMQKAQAETARFRTQTQASLEKLTSSFSRFGKAVVGYYSITHIAQFIGRTLEAADALGETADQAGIGAEAMQRLQFAFTQLSQASTEQTTRGLSTFNENLGKARVSSLELQKAFNDLGVDLHKNTEAALRQTLERLAAIEDPAVRAAKAAELFGDRFGPKVAGALGKGIDVIDAYMKAATGIITQDMIDKGSQLTDQMAAFQKTVDAAATKAIIDNADSIKYLGDAMSAAVGWASRLATGARNLGKDIGAALERWTRPKDPSDLDMLGLGPLASFGGAGVVQRGNDPVTPVVDSMNELVVVDLAAVAAQEKLRKAAEAMTASIDAQIASLQLQADTLGMTEAQAAMYGIQMEATKKGLHGLTLEQYAAASAAIDSIERQKKALDDFDQAIQTDAEEQADLLTRTKDFSAALALDAEEKFGRMGVFIDQAARNMQDSLAQFLFDPFKDGIDGMLSGLLDVLRQMVAQMAAADLFGALGGMANRGGVLGAIGSFFAPRAEGGAVMAGAGYMVGERGPELFIPNANGQIVPNGGGGGVVINQQINAAPGTSPADLQAVMLAAKNSAIAEIDSRTRRTRGKR